MSVTLILLMVKATVLEIVPEHVKGTKLNGHNDENVNVTSSVYIWYRMARLETVYDPRKGFQQKSGKNISLE